MSERRGQEQRTPKATIPLMFKRFRLTIKGIHEARREGFNPIGFGLQYR